ncbi:MAG TPA: hypothetical protein VF574_18170 [Allosphingosinicella sp.]
MKFTMSEFFKQAGSAAWDATRGPGRAYGRGRREKIGLHRREKRDSPIGLYGLKPTL